MRNIHLDTFIGLFMLLVSGFFYSLTDEMPDDPAEFPQLVLILLMVFSLVIMLKGVMYSLKARNEGAMVEKYLDKIRGPAIVYLALCVNVGLIQILGFFTATTIASAFFMVLFGIRSYVKIFMTLLGINIFIYSLFVWQLKISLPTGLLI